MKRSVRLLITALLAVFFIASAAVSASADAFDPGRTASLTLVYKYEGNAYEGLPINTYFVAEVDSELKFKLADDFAAYPVEVNGIRSQGEWRLLGDTLASYIIADKPAPAASALTDASGTVKFEGLRPGLYLTLGVSRLDENAITDFETFFSVIPYPETDGSYNYNVTAYPKASGFVPGDNDSKMMKVVKQWKDGSGLIEHRPASVKVDIYNNGVYKTTVTLSSENNWTYSWVSPIDGTSWTAVEREVPSGYTVTIENNGDTIIVTNVRAEGGDTPTGDIAVKWVYMAALSFTGIILMAIGAGRKRRRG